MESIEDHRINSGEEVDDQPDQQDVGTGRFYECMFCKRGFTTAQALGGHMNIHRKDRAKITRHNSSTKHSEESNYAGPRIYQPVFSSYTPQYYVPSHEAQVHYQTYFPSNSSVTRLSYDQSYNHINNHSPEQNHQRLISPCGEDLRMGLSLQYGSSYGEDMDQRKSYRVRNYEEDGLDLELRLGHHDP